MNAKSGREGRRVAGRRLGDVVVGALVVVAIGAAAVTLWPGGDDVDDASDKHEGHGIGPVEFVALPDAEQDVLDGQWDRARAAALAYPTVQDALDAGFEVMQGNPETGAHVVLWDRMDDRFSIDEPEQLLYESEAPDAEVMALSYMVVTDSATPPEGFESANDQWHEHRGVCIDGDRRVQGMDISAEECTRRDGEQGASDGWMLHVWILPGWENDDGIYAASNPDIRLGG